MAYLVMETGRAFAVVLDGDGRFIKVANLNYAVGDTVEEVVELREPEKKRAVRPAVYSLLAAAACAALLFFGPYRANFTPYGTVRISINPDVLLTVSKTERVLELEGLNADGEELIASYDHKGKKQAQVSSELVERAADMGYLADGGDVEITLAGEDSAWEDAAESGIADRVEADVADLAITVFLAVSGESEPRRVISAATESGLWQSWDSYEDYSTDMHARWGEQAGEYLKTWGEETGALLERFGEETGERLEQFGQETGEYFEQFGEAMGSGEQWKSFAHNGLGGLIDGIFGLFG